MKIIKKHTVVIGKEQFCGWLRRRHLCRCATGHDPPFRQLNLHVLKTRLAVGVCVYAGVLHLPSIALPFVIVAVKNIRPMKT